MVDTPEAIEADHPGWRVWRARRGDELGSWMASRHDPDAGQVPTLMEKTPEQLREALRRQRQRAG